MNSLNYIIIPVHNRKNTTLKCLETLKENGDLTQYNILVIDDGSTDGTSEAIRAQYPSVTMLYGDGNLWWGGAIRKGMEYAYEQGAEYFIWLNDDCYPSPGAIDTIVKFCQHHPKAIVGAQCIDPETLQFSYGGIRLRNYKIQSINAEIDEYIECDALNGNLVCLPRSIVDTIGYPDSINFPHHYNDFVYTFQSQKKNYKLFIYNQLKVYCKNPSLNQSWLTSLIPDLLEIWKSYLNETNFYYWKIGLKAYRIFFGFPGIMIYLNDRIIKLFLVFLIVSILPLAIRQNLSTKIKHLKRG